MPTTPGGRSLGVRFDLPEDRRNFPFAFTPLAAPPPDIDLRHLMQPVGDQGAIGSCTGWAGTSSVESHLRDQQRSPLYVYYRAREADGANPPTQDTGATMLGVCKALQGAGAPPEAVWPYVMNRYNLRPSVEADQAAQGARVDTYYQIKATGLQLLQGVWAALSQGQTVLVALYVYPEFEQMARDGKAPMPRAGSRPLGGHAITACGWRNDPSAPGGYGWVLCQNSWGTGFGYDGYVWLPDAYFTSGIVLECWVLQWAAPPPEPEPEPPSPSGDWRPYVEDASRLVKQVRATDWAQWPPGTLEQADADLDAALGLAPPEPEPPPPTPDLSPHGGSYPGHDPARDIYPREWGPNHGIVIRAPAPGIVERYDLGPVPLPANMAPGYAARREALFQDWVCRLPPTAGQQHLIVAVYWPDRPLDGLRALWFGHVRDDVPVGRVETGGRVCTTWDSGIRFEALAPLQEARAAHVHCAGSETGQLSPNGTVDGFRVWRAMGLPDGRGHPVPGPNEYMTTDGQGHCRYCAGKPRQEWQRRPIPPMPR